MHLYHLTVLPPSGATALAYGSFSAARQQEVVLASGSTLHLLRLTRAGALASVARADAFAAVRALSAFRLPGSRRDMLLVTSDAGVLAVLAFDARARAFVPARREPFGRSGVRRAVPGHMLAADPKGRACMVAAVERSKFAYILTRADDPADHVQVQSPLEAHRAGVATHALVALDAAFANPVFAALERAYDPADAPKMLVYYELDLGLNHVVRRCASPVADHSFVLLPVPGGAEGPGGVLVCSPGRVTYRNLTEEEEEDDDAAAGLPPPPPRVAAALPYRLRPDRSAPDTDEHPMVVSGTMHMHKGMFFFVLCTEHGDLLKVELDWSEEAGAVELRVMYFDTLPAPAHALAIFRSGYLFAALETGDPMFLQFKATSVAEDDAAGGWSSSKNTLLGAELSETMLRASSSSPVRAGEISAGSASQNEASSIREHSENAVTATSPMDTSDSTGGAKEGRLASTRSGSGNGISPLSRSGVQPASGGVSESAAPRAVVPSNYSDARGRFDALGAGMADSSRGFRGGSNTVARRRCGFVPRSHLTYFTATGVIQSLAPSTAIASGDFCGEGSSQLVCIGGRGRQSSLRVLRRGFAVLEFMSQAMPGPISGLFTLKERADSLFERYIVVSFANATKVLRVSDESVGEAYDTGLLSSGRTMAAEQVGASSLLQVHPDGVRIVWNGNAESVVQWAPPPGIKVLAAATNRAQVVAALSSGDVAYFEVAACRESERMHPLHTLSGALPAVISLPLDSNGFSASLPAVAISDVPAGRKKASLFAVSDGQSSMVRLYQIDGDDEVKSVGVHMAPAPVESLALVDFGDLSGDALVTATGLASTSSKKAGADAHKGEHDESSVPIPPMLCLAVGTRKGALITLRVDHVSGAMSGKRSKFVGPSSVRVQRLKMAGVPSCFAMSVRPWLLHRQGPRVATSPLCTDSMDCVAAFSSEQSPDGFVAVAGSTLRFLALESLSALSASAALPSRVPTSLVPADTALGSTFFMSKSCLVCTPRRIAPVFSRSARRRRRANGNSNMTEMGGKNHEAVDDGLFVVIESEHRVKLESRASGPLAKSGSGVSDVRYALSAATSGSWSSLVRLVSIKSPEDEEDQGALSDEGSNGVADGKSGSGNGDAGDAGREEEDDEEEVYAKACSTLDVLPLRSSDARALCVTTSTHLGGPDDETPYVVVSVARHSTCSATSTESARERLAAEGGGGDHAGPSGELHVFRVNITARKLERLHVTRISSPSLAVAGFRDKLLVGTGTSLRLYELGKKQLLRKAESRMVTSKQICALAVAGGDRVFVGDVQDSVTLLKYYPPSLPSTNNEVIRAVSARSGRDVGRFAVIARDGFPRHVVSLVSLDYNSVCGSDKFGNIFILRLPAELSGAAEQGTLGVMESGMPGSTGRPSVAHRLAVEACFFVGSTVLGLARGSLQGGTGIQADGTSLEDEHECIIYSTMGGAIGALSPFSVKSDIDLAVSLEKQMRERHVSLVGRSHVSYRSSFAPVRHVVDGDLCEAFTALPLSEQVEAAKHIDREVPDIHRKLDEFRLGVL